MPQSPRCKRRVKAAYKKAWAVLGKLLAQVDDQRSATSSVALVRGQLVGSWWPHPVRVLRQGGTLVANNACPIRRRSRRCGPCWSRTRTARSPRSTRTKGSSSRSGGGHRGVSGSLERPADVPPAFDGNRLQSLDAEVIPELLDQMLDKTGVTDSEHR